MAKMAPIHDRIGPGFQSVSELAEAATPPLFGPGTLGAALVAEAEGRGSVRFCQGEPYWVADPARFPIVTEVAL